MTEREYRPGQTWGFYVMDDSMYEKFTIDRIDEGIAYGHTDEDNLALVGIRRLDTADLISEAPDSLPLHRWKVQGDGCWWKIVGGHWASDPSEHAGEPVEVMPVAEYNELIELMGNLLAYFVGKSRESEVSSSDADHHHRAHPQA